MAYFKVLIKEEFVYEVLVKASDEVSAKLQVLNGTDGWGDAIQVTTHAYDIVELTEKPV